MEEVSTKDREEEKVGQRRMEGERNKKENQERRWKIRK